MDGSLREDGTVPADYAYNRDVTRAVVQMAHASRIMPLPLEAMARHY